MIQTTTPLCKVILLNYFKLKLVLFFLIAGHVVVKWITCSRTFVHGLKPPNQMHIRSADENIISRYSRPDKN